MSGIDLDPYDARFTPLPFKLQNVRSSCYINSTLQVLLSCSSFVKSILTNEEYCKTSKAADCLYRDLISAFNCNESVIGNSYRLFIAMNNELEARGKIKSSFESQECAGEFLTLLLETIDPVIPYGVNPTSYMMKSPITKRFISQTKKITKCNLCGFEYSERLSKLIINLYTPIEPTTPENFAKIIRVNTEEVNNVKCEQCKAVGKFTAIESMVMSPEIIVISFIFRFGASGQLCYFPHEFSFKSNRDTHLLYRIAGKIEHLGKSPTQESFTSFGHYLAYAERQGKIYYFNDTVISESNNDILLPENSTQTFLLFYQFIKEW